MRTCIKRKKSTIRRQEAKDSRDHIFSAAYVYCEVDFRDYFRVVWKEIRVGLACGITLAAVNFGKIWIVRF